MEQIIYVDRDSGNSSFPARSAGFRDEWLPEVQRLCRSFGARPEGVACPSCVFAQPLGKQHVAVVQVADLGEENPGQPGPLGFRLLALKRDVYAALGGNPFQLADSFPAPWKARGELPTLLPPASPPRTLERVQSLLEGFRAIQPTLLGSVQALVDGSRVVFERSEPDTDLLHCLWDLLPTQSRCQLWPASFAFGNALGFDVLVVPQVSTEDLAGYITEGQAGDYPEGRYELNLQIAVESGDQAGLEALFARRSYQDVWRLGLVLVGVVVILTLVMGWLKHL